MNKILTPLSFLLLVACNSTPKPAEEQLVQGEAQGTTYTIKYRGKEELNLKTQIDSLLTEIDLSLSTYLPTSTISQLNNSDSALIDDKFKRMFELSKELNETTDGAFDPTIGPLIKAWGFDYANPQRMDSTIVDSLLQFCGFRNFELNGSKLMKSKKSATLNFNAIAQGYSVDLMADLLDRYKIENYYVELGGEVKVKGKNGQGVFWRVGIDRPKDHNMERELSAIVSLENQSMVTSGNYRNFYEIDGKRYSHSLNPTTGYPAENTLLSVTVITEGCAEADAFATAFMVMGLEKTKAFLTTTLKL